MSSQANARFLASTRGQVVILLRQGLATVDELATTLGLTDNAVRAHLAGLERDGLVVQAGVRRGGGKPAYTYAITADAEQLFPKAYGAILSVLLDVLGEFAQRQRSGSVRLGCVAITRWIVDSGFRLSHFGGLAKGGC